jgi:diguanylate cyclase (GGDEF)-like protein
LLKRRTFALLELTRATFAAVSGPSLDFGPILEKAAEVIDVERAGFWRYLSDPRALRCEHLYLRASHRHLKDGAEVRKATASMPAGSGSRLEAPVRVSDKVVGLVGLEGQGSRPWTEDDRLFADAVGDFIALALESWPRRAAEARLAYASLRDPLTDLPNRGLFLERVERSLRGLERQRGLVAVLSLNVDRFQQINETLGRPAGDDVLVAIAHALTAVLRPADLPARLEGDGFGVLIEQIHEPWEAIAVAERVQAALSRSMTLSGASVSPTASIGVALADDSRPTSAADLIRDAEIAMRRAKKKGRGRYEVFGSAMRRELLERMAAGWELREALAAGRLVLYYQPERSLADGRLLAVEALLRWNRPGHGQLTAGTFIDIAESSDLILPIGTWVLREACRQAKAWRALPREAGSAGGASRAFMVRVNLSAHQFERADIVDTVAATLRETGLPPDSLCLEITETVLMSNAAASMGTLTALKALGVRLAVDDFGTGYSSLAYLKRFPVDTLKIDRSFVEGLGQDPIDLPIVQAILSLGRTLGLEVVAEGVERPSQEQTLRALGCDRVQGFLYGQAMPASEIEPLLGGPAGPPAADGGSGPG